jgi:Macrocin-O-methyltransferase (TylF)
MTKVPPMDAARQLYRERDENHWKELQGIVEESGISFSEMLINYPAFVRRRELTRLLADYDLFRMVMHLPGSIVELGVYLGAGLFTWAKLLETFFPGDRSRRAYGFESGKGYAKLSPEDGQPQAWIANAVGEKKVSDRFLDRMVELTNDDNLVRGAERCRIFKGDILETVPEFARGSQGTRISLLFFDANLYEPTLVGLRALYPLVTPGGVIVLNGYGAPPFPGEGLALEHYFGEIGEPLPKLMKLPYSIRPGGYFLKDGR